MRVRGQVIADGGIQIPTVPGAVALGTDSSGNVVPGAPPIPTVPRIDFCGHSIPGAGGTSGGDHNAYPDKLAKMLGAQKRANIAKGGSISCWQSANANGDGGYSWVLNMFQPPNNGDDQGTAVAPFPPRTSVAVIHNIENDIAAIGAASLKPSMEALKTIISRYCTSALYDDADASWTWGTAMSALTGSWTYSAGTSHYCTWNGAFNAQQYGTWSCPNTYPGNRVIAIGLAVVPGAVGTGATSTVALTIDGVEYDYTLNLDKNGYADAENGKTNGVVLRFGRADCGLGLAQSGLSAPIPALAAGAHTIKVALKSATANGTFFVVDYAQIESDPLDGPVIVVPSNFRAASPTNGGYNLWASGWLHGPTAGADPMNDASIASANTQVQTALTDFPGRCVYVDIDTPLGKNPTNLSGDYTHPNNGGHSLIAQTIYDAIKASGLLTSRVLSKTSMRSLGQYEGGFWSPLSGDFNVSVGPSFGLNWGRYPGNALEWPGYRKGLDGHIYLRGAAQLSPITYPGSFAAAPSAGGGTFTAGTKYYKITAITAAGESLPSPEISAVVVANGKVALTWNSVSFATGYKIYRATAAGGEGTTPALVTTIASGATTSYTDTGTATVAGAVPATNTAFPGISAALVSSFPQNVGYSPLQPGDQTVAAFTGTTWILGILRHDPGNNGLYFILGGNASGNVNYLTSDWMAESS